MQTEPQNQGLKSIIEAFSWLLEIVDYLETTYSMANRMPLEGGPEKRYRVILDNVRLDLDDADCILLSAAVRLGVDERWYNYLQDIPGAQQRYVNSVLGGYYQGRTGHPVAESELTDKFKALQDAVRENAQVLRSLDLKSEKLNCEHIYLALESAYED